MKNSWEVFKLDELVIGKGEYGINAAACEYNPNLNTYLRITDITGDGRFIEKGKKSVNHPDAEKFVLKEGDITFARTGASTGKTYLYNADDGKLVFAGFLIRFKPDPLKLDSWYLKFVTQTYNYKNWVSIYSARTGQPGINSNEYGEYIINLPPLLQQKKIAKILSTVDKVIEKTESAIAKYQAIKQGLMHDLFTRGIDVNTGKLRPTPQDVPDLYKVSALGLIPRDWDIDALENVANYVDYRGKTPPKSDKGIYLITAKNIKFGYIDYEISKEYILKSSYKATMSRGIPEIGDILITTEAPLGNVAQINIEGLALAQRVIKYRCLEAEMLNDFLKHSMMAEYFQKEIHSESTGSTVKGIKGSRLHKLQVYKPKIDEQNRIVQSLKPLDSKIQIEQQALAKYRQIKAGLLQDLLTGKVVVSVD